MSEPVWIREDVARAIHRRQIAEHGGLDGLRDPGLLTSALARPKSLLAYGDPAPDLAALAAAYAWGVARNQAVTPAVVIVAASSWLQPSGARVNHVAGRVTYSHA